MANHVCLFLSGGERRGFRDSCGEENCHHCWLRDWPRPGTVPLPLVTEHDHSCRWTKTVLLLMCSIYFWCEHISISKHISKTCVASKSVLYYSEINVLLMKCTLGILWTIQDGGWPKALCLLGERHGSVSNVIRPPPLLWPVWLPPCPLHLPTMFE